MKTTMTPLETVLAIETRKRDLYLEFGFKNGKEYYDLREKVYAELEGDFAVESNGYDVTVGEKYHIIRKGTPLDVIPEPKLVFKRKD